MRQPDTYIICTSPRSGSTLLCSILRATGRAGYPASWFHEPSLEHWAAELDVPPVEGRCTDQIATLIEAARHKGRAGGALFALRLQRQSAGFFLNTLAHLHPDTRNDLSRIKASFGETCFLFLRRRNKVAQAISYMRAQQSGLWHRAADGSELERLARHCEPTYDAAFISQWVEIFSRYDTEWQTWFDHEKIDAREVIYEDLASEPVRILRTVLAALSIDPQLADGIEPGVQRLSDATSAELIARFERDTLKQKRDKRPHYSGAISGPNQATKTNL
ncbi:MAG: Stf0 family sulfotransferase [Pseudomonadota bacterium]